MKFDNFLLNYFRPNATLDNFSQITKEYLISNKIKLIICDLDNTLVPHFSFLPNKNVINFFNLIKELDIKIYIASNNTKKRVSRFAHYLPQGIIENYIWNSKKPFTKKIKTFVKEINNYPTSQILVIGDQFITDIWFANRMKFKSLLLLPSFNPSINSQKNFLIKILDKIIYQKIAHKNLLIPITEIKEENEIDII